MNTATAEAMERARARQAAHRRLSTDTDRSRTGDDNRDRAREELTELASLEQIAKEMES